MKSVVLRVARFGLSSLIGLLMVVRTIAPAISAPLVALPIEAAMDIRELSIWSPMSLSPDGKLVAVVISRQSIKEPYAPGSSYFSTTGMYAQAFGTDVLVIDTSNGAVTDIGRTENATTAPMWSPDASKLAYVSDRDGVSRIWIWERATKLSHRASDAPVFDAFAFQVPRWLPDSKHLLFKTTPFGKSLVETIAASASVATPAPSVTPVAVQESHPIVYSYDPSATPAPSIAASVSKAPPWAYRESADLVLLDVTTGSIERLSNGAFPIGYQVSPDGSKVAYANLLGMADETSQQFLFDLLVYDRASHTTKTVVSHAALDYGSGFSWSPDSSRIAYSTAGVDVTLATKQDEHTRGDIYVVGLDGKAPHNLTPGTHPSYHHVLQAPLWTADGTLLIFYAGASLYRVASSGGTIQTLSTLPGSLIRGLVASPFANQYALEDHDPTVDLWVRNTENFSEGVVRVDLTTGTRQSLFDAPLRFGDPTMSVGIASGVIVYAGEDAKTGVQLYVATAGFAHRRVLYNLNPQLDGYTLGRSRVIDYNTTDGQHLHAALLLPGDYEPGRRYPLVVRVYGGESSSSQVHAFGLQGPGPDNMQILASRGYAVLEPDTPLREGQPLKDLALTVMPAIDRTIALGIVDPSRIAVEGHSYGGYSTLALIVQSTRFKAAIDDAGVADLLSSYLAFDSGGAYGIGWAEEGQGRMRASPWAQFQRYVDNSPLWMLDRVQTPLLILHGGADDNVHLEQTDAVFVAMRRLKKPVTYVIYPGEEHWEGTWKLADVIDVWNRMLAFLGAELHPESR